VLVADRVTPEWLSLTAYARVYGVDRATVYKWLDAGLLETYTVLGLRRIKHQPPSDTSVRPPKRRLSSGPTS
jgi:predicted site-specific integrase-resolvase